jgi:hypothetical protein
MRLTMEQRDSNLVMGGNYSPFVFVDADGVHVGDQDNHRIFESARFAIEHVRFQILPAKQLAKARRADPQGNDFARALWHEDAALQLDALYTLALEAA